jgi:hypothetical protein
VVWFQVTVGCSWGFKVGSRKGRHDKMSRPLEVKIIGVDLIGIR